MTTITIDLGPGNLANPEYSPFKIPQMYWAELSGFLEAPLLLKPTSVDSISTALNWMGEGKLSILLKYKMQLKTSIKPATTKTLLKSRIISMWTYKPGKQ